MKKARDHLSMHERKITNDKISTKIGTVLTLYKKKCEETYTCTKLTYKKSITLQLYMLTKIKLIFKMNFSHLDIKLL